ncbi:hypothetical protein FA10DRAFT_262482 [Acaromyces ingoldii]|uniref:Uncharacterized protein n=1 Tax=Acaromyces ingoldii TaxID=215250 RepID=A0A316YGS8_9BASI|nr:hypothetical protein FA10DRAFT_262482 [Acaromyces ingoldii]PWN87313.1 hypothetical protein FA10DRAFT_262482 [Acaromyces ingoldii]
MRCLLAIGIGSLFLSPVLGRAANGKLASSRNIPSTDEVVTASHTPLLFLPDRPQSASLLLVQQPSVSCEDRRPQTLHLFDCNGDAITTYIRSNGQEMTTRKFVRRAVDRSSSHTVYRLMDMQQAGSIEEKFENLCQKRVDILQGNLNMFQELAQGDEVTSSCLGLLREQCRTLELHIRKAQKQCNKYLQDTEEAQRKSHSRRKTEASSSRQHFAKRDGNDLRARAPRDGWYKDNQKALERIESLKRSLESMIKGRDERGLAVDEMVKKSIDNITNRYREQVTFLKQMKKIVERNINSSYLLGGLVEHVRREANAIKGALEDAQRQFGAHCQKFNIAECGEEKGRLAY